MPKSTTHGVAWSVLLVLVAPVTAFGWQAGAGADIIDTIRTRTDIGAGDQGRIKVWIDQQVAAFAPDSGLRTAMTQQFIHAANTPEFLAAFAAKVGEAAATNFGRANLSAKLASTLAGVLADIKRVETLTGLLAGLKSTDATARYLCTITLVRLKGDIAADAASVDRVVAACRPVALVETDSVVLGQLYNAMAYSGFVPNVFDAYLAVFDKRLTARRQSPSYTDGKELAALEFFVQASVQAALTADQKTQLVLRLATFLRLDAERYADPNITFEETDAIERVLWVAEEILAALTGQTGGDIRGTLRATGSTNRPGVVAEAYKWVGKPGTTERGPLNAAPWNVPIAAP